MLSQYAIDSNLSVWTEKVIWRLIQNWKESSQIVVPEIPETPKENQRSNFVSTPRNGGGTPASDLKKPKTPRDTTSFQKYTKKGQFEALRASFETGAVKG